jgi:hypothetical protein
MSAEIHRDLEMQKLIQDLETELARRHNWAQQEAFWQRQMSNWESQERYWRWQQWILLGTFVIGVLGIVSRVFWP